MTAVIGYAIINEKIQDNRISLVDFSEKFNILYYIILVI